MATLQKLRNMGPLLVIFVGLALFAFIAGDAVKLFDSHSIDTSVGTVGDSEIDAMEYQQVYNELDCFCKVSGYEIPEESRQVMVWNLLSNSALYNNYAKELGITITPEEVNLVLTNGKSDFVRTSVQPQSAFRAGGNFNMQFLAELIQVYEEQKLNGMIDSNVDALYNSWKYIEREVVLEMLRKKVNTLASEATIANPAVAQKNFDLNNNTYTLNVALYPFNRMDIDNIEVTEEEIAKSYEENKANNPYLSNEVETRDIKYIVKQVVPSEKDLANLKADMTKYADSLRNGYDKYQKLARISRSMVPYNNFLLPKALLDPTVAAAIDTLEVNEVLGPVDQTIAVSRDQFINTYDVYMNVEKATVPESFMIRAITISEVAADGTTVDLNVAADSLLNLLNNGADFKAVASNYRAQFDSLTINTDNANEVFGLVDDIDTQKDIYNAPVGQYLTSDINVQGFNGKLLFQVIEKNGSVDAYNTFVIRREKVFSNETYNEEYDKFCKFVGSCQTLAELEEKVANDESQAYWILPQQGVTTGSAIIANISKTSDFIDWIFNEDTKPGQISSIKKCGNDDVFMAVALENINEKGYKPLTSELSPGRTVSDFAKRMAQSEKAKEQAMAEMKDKSYNDLKNNSKISTYTIDKVEFKKPTNVSSTMQDEVAIAAVASKMNAGETSAPFEGVNGVYVIEVASKDAKNGTFDATAEKQQIESLYNRNYIVTAVEKALGKIYPMENRVYVHF
ncbi:MAG: SurA N-terminal domain-containing protein [Bacteroidaceae bacterium]|nr:SurA N-terminal domain-containing protein [Bacteroidaceae bacterium]